MYSTTGIGYGGLTTMLEKVPYPAHYFFTHLNKLETTIFITNKKVKQDTDMLYHFPYLVAKNK